MAQLHLTTADHTSTYPDRGCPGSGSKVAVVSLTTERATVVSLLHYLIFHPLFVVDINRIAYKLHGLLEIHIAAQNAHVSITYDLYGCT